MNRTQKFDRLFAVLTKMCLLAGVSVSISAGVFAASEQETQLIELLKSDAPKSEKALACKKLAVYGSSEAVPELAKLLTDAELASWCRIALEAIPGDEANEALRASLPMLEGRLLVGAINSLGVRHDADAVEPLTERLTDANPDVASAAAVALGHIGNSTATESLRKKLATAPEDVRSAIAEGLVLCAERAVADDRAAEAVELYDQVRQADVPRPRIREATRGAILARGQDGIPLLVEQLNSPDKDLFQIGLSTAREFPGKKVDETLAKEMAKAVPVRAALLVQAMADRPQTVVLPAILKAAESGAQPVRIAAIGAVGRVGNASCLPSLLKIALEDDETLAPLVKKALTDLPGETVDQDIVKRLDKAEGKIYPLLLELVGERRIDAIPPLIKALNHADKAVRSAALISLGNTVPQEKLSVLITQVVSPKKADDAATAQLALMTASVRMPDREACATELAAAMDKAPAAKKVALLEIIGAVSGTKALETVAAAAKSSDPALQNTSSDLLGKWMTIDAAPVLLDLTKNGPEKFHVRAQRGYMRIARQFIMPDDERIEMCRNAFEFAKQPAEQKLVLELLQRPVPHLEKLKLAIQATEKYSELKNEALQAVAAIAQKLNDKQAEVKELLAELKFDKVKLEIVKAEYGAGTTQKDVTEALQKNAGESQLILLPSGYNDLFGGDPAPGTAKQLKIQYRINGKAGEASFAENSPILLPMPK
jgi:HEAT repeat protein